MTKVTEGIARPPSAPVALALAWLLPGLGHFWIGERARALILFVVVTVTFWGGVAVGGVRTTVTPKENGAWIAAQLCTGPQTLLALYLSHRQIKAAKEENRVPFRAAWPSSNIGVVYAGVAGLLNLLVIIDVLSRAEARQASAPARSPQRQGGR